MEDEQLSQKLNSNEVLEQNMNTEENNLYIPPSDNNLAKEESKQNSNISSPYIPSNSNINMNTGNSSNTSNKVDTNSIWYDLSILSWFLFLCTAWNLFKESSSISSDLLLERPYKPLYADLSLAIAITSAISTLGFILYFRKTTFNKAPNILNGMLGDISKYHFIPLLLVSFLFISLTNGGRKESFVFSLIFSILSYVSSIYIYFNTDFSADWYEIITIKKGTFSCLIALSWYTFFFSFASLGLYKEDPFSNFLKGCGIAFSLLIGIGNLGVCFFFKDLFIGIINLILYIEMAKFFYLGQEYHQRKADGIIDIIMIVLNSGVIFYLFFKERESLHRS